MARSDGNHRPVAGRTLDSVVVGVDGSEASAATLQWAAWRVTDSGSLHVVQAVDRSDDPVAIRDSLEGEWTESARGRCQQVECHVEEGDPVDVLLARAERVAAGLVAVGAHGAGGGDRPSPFLGGVTRRLLGRSNLPIVIHHGSTEPADGPVIAGIGYGGPTEVAGQWAARYADATGRPLVLLHAVSRRPLYPLDSPVDMLGSFLGPGVDLEWAESDLEARRDEVLDRFHDLDVSTRVVRGSAVRGILDAARDPGSGSPAEIVVVGRPGDIHLPTSPRLHQIIARAETPTAVVPARFTGG